VTHARAEERTISALELSSLGEMHSLAVTLTLNNTLLC
jgi:hypothetical protein